MNIDQFVIMDAVVRLGSFSAAAREANRVQSAVSYNIKTLEGELGVVLFDRETYRPELTPAGEAVYRKARELLMSVREIELLSTHLTRGREALVRFDIAPTCPLDDVVRVLKIIGDEYPETRLEISMEIFGGEALVLDDAVDLSLTDMVHSDDRVEIVPWRNVPLIPVVSPNHPLASHGEAPISRAQILKHVQIVVASTSPLTESKTLGVLEGNPTWSVSDFATKRKLILAGLGWGNLPDYLIGEDVETGRLIAVTPPGLPRPMAELRLVRKRWKAHGPVASQLWNLLATHRQEHLLE